MNKNRRAISVTTILVLLWLLIGSSGISIAENIPISEKGLERIGLNRIRLESGIGVIVFNLSEAPNRLKASGFLTVSNTYNVSVTIKCKIVTKLSDVDLDKDGSYRVHKTISDSITFYPLPDSSLVTLEDDEAVINPYSIYNFRYEVSIPLDEEIEFPNNKGYLLYINVRRGTGDVTGAQICIDYDYKIFLIFTGKLQVEEGFFKEWMLLVSIPIIVSIVGFAIYKQKRKGDPFKIKKQIDPFEIRTAKSKTHEKGTDAILHQKIDKLTELSDNRGTSRGKNI